MNRCVKAWRGIIILWLSSLMLVSLVAVPLKHALKADLGNSMITEKLASGINIEAFADLGSSFRNLGSYFFSGFLIAILIGLVINAFLTGGMFSSLNKSAVSFSTQEYFRASARYFWSFLTISVFISLIILFLFILVCLVPVSIVLQSDAAREGALFKTAVISGSAFFLLAAVLLIVADYSRAWQASCEKPQFLKAIGFGFRYTFRTFASSFSLMLIVLLVQFLFGWLVMLVIPGIRPAGEAGIILLFLLSQSLFLIKIFLKAWRFGTMTCLMEYNLSESFRSESM